MQYFELVISNFLPFKLCKNLQVYKFTSLQVYKFTSLQGIRRMGARPISKINTFLLFWKQFADIDIASLVRRGLVWQRKKIGDMRKLARFEKLSNWRSQNDLAYSYHQTVHVTVLAY